MTATAPAPTVTRDRLTGDYDVAVTGAGFAGMYLLHRLRSAGLRAVVFERGTGRLVAVGVNGVTRLNNSTAHAEMLALELQQWHLNALLEKDA